MNHGVRVNLVCPGGLKTSGRRDLRIGWQAAKASGECCSILVGRALLWLGGFLKDVKIRPLGQLRCQSWAPGGSKKSMCVSKRCSCSRFLPGMIFPKKINKIPQKVHSAIGARPFRKTLAALERQARNLSIEGVA